MSIKVTAMLRAIDFHLPLMPGRRGFTSNILGVGGEPRSKPSNPRIKEVLNMTIEQILYPSDYSEFEVQAYLYSKLLRMGFDVRGEVSAVNVMGKGSRFDLVIFKKGKATKIIEVKKTREQRIHTQKVKYNRYGVGVHFVMGMEDAEKYIKDIRDYRKYLNKQKKLHHHTHYGNKRSTWRDSGRK